MAQPALHVRGPTGMAQQPVARPASVQCPAWALGSHRLCSPASGLIRPDRPWPSIWIEWLFGVFGRIKIQRISRLPQTLVSIHPSPFSQLSTSGSSCAAGGGGQRRRFAPSPACCELRPPAPWPVTLELPFFLFFSRHGAVAAMDSSLEVAAPPRAPSPACAPTKE